METIFMVPQDLLDTNRNPNVGERQYFTALAKDTDEQIRSIDKAIRELEAKKAPLLETSMKCRQVLAPIRRLPRDIIEEIFKACVADEEWPGLVLDCAPILLTRISSGLRHIALTCPYLWSKFWMDLRELLPEIRDIDERIAKVKASGLEEWIRRSGSQPLSIMLQCNWIEHPEVLQKYLAPVLKNCVLRWKYIFLDSTTTTTMLSLIREECPLLTKLILELDRSEKGDNELVTSSPMLKAPNLKELVLFGKANPLEYNVGWSRLTHLDLDFSASEDIPLLVDLAAILRQTKALVRLVLIMPDMESDIVGAISLPVLKTLESIEKTNEVSIPANFVRYIHAPLLTTLIADNIEYGFEDFLKRCTRLQNFTIFCNNNDASILMPWLRHLPLLVKFAVKGFPRDRWDQGILEAFVSEQDAGMLCPELQEFRSIPQIIRVSTETLTTFLRSAQLQTSRRKYRTINMNVNISDWNSGTAQLLDELVLEQRNAGMNLSLFVDNSQHHY